MIKEEAEILENKIREKEMAAMESKSNDFVDIKPIVAHCELNPQLTTSGKVLTFQDTRLLDDEYFTCIKSALKVVKPGYYEFFLINNYKGDQDIKGIKDMVLVNKKEIEGINIYNESVKAVNFFGREKLNEGDTVSCITSVDTELVSGRLIVNFINVE